jgi:hypothetical protein
MGSDVSAPSSLIFGTAVWDAYPTSRMLNELLAALGDVENSASAEEPLEDGGGVGTFIFAA